MASFMLSNRHDAMFYGHCTTINELEVFSNINWDNFDKGTFASIVLYSPSPFRAIVKHRTIAIARPSRYC